MERGLELNADVQSLSADWKKSKKNAKKFAG